MIKVNFKSPAHDKPISMDIDTNSVKDIGKLKDKLGEKVEATRQNIKLVFKGRLLKDQDSVQQLRLVNGDTLHAVIKSPQGQRSSSPVINQYRNENRNNQAQGMQDFGNLGNFTNLANLANIGGRNSGSSANMGNMSNLAALAGLANMGNLGNTNRNANGNNPLNSISPEVLQQLITSVNPQAISQSIQNNPTIRQLYQNMPEVRNLLSNPQTFENIMTQVRNSGAEVVGGIGNLINLFGNMNGLNRTEEYNRNIDYREIYKKQLKELDSMGFTNSNTNIEALKSTNGSIEGAIEKLLGMPC